MAFPYAVFSLSIFSSVHARNSLLQHTFFLNYLTDSEHLSIRSPILHTSSSPSPSLPNSHTRTMTVLLHTNETNTLCSRTCCRFAIFFDTFFFLFIGLHEKLFFYEYTIQFGPVNFCSIECARAWSFLSLAFTRFIAFSLFFLLLFRHYFL